MRRVLYDLVLDLAIIVGRAQSFISGCVSDVKVAEYPVSGRVIVVALLLVYAPARLIFLVLFAASSALRPAGPLPRP